MSHTHFTLQERLRIQIHLEDNLGFRAIARKLGVSHTAINREVRANSVTLETVKTTRVNVPRVISVDLRTRRGCGEVPDKLAARERYRQRLARFVRGQPIYDAQVAQALYLVRRQAASSRNLKLHDDSALGERITQLLTGKDRDSPEQIAANLKKQAILISYQTIYRWIERSDNRKTLVQGLRRRGRRYRYAAATARKWNKTTNKRSIHARPAVIEQLTRYGDLEGDTIFGSDTKDRILTHVDRVTGVASLSRILGYDAHKIHTQTLKDISRVFGDGVHTITYDNGSEFATWKKTEAALGATIFFADPYRSSQRGRNEHANGLVRDYFPKGTDFKQITNRQLREVETILNNRSRKRYNWRNPIEQRRLILVGA